MVSKIFKKIIFLFGIIFFMGVVSASFTSGKLNHSIDESYGPNDNIRGWINISLNNEPADSIITGLIKYEEIEENISLMNLIKKESNSDFIYTCSPSDCNSDYIANIGAVSKLFSLNDGESTLVGFKITEKKLIDDISSFSIRINSSNSLESTNLPLSIDVLDDDQIDWKVNSTSGNFNSKNYGCYIDNSNAEQSGIITTRYCEKIILSQAPIVRIGAEVIGSGNVNFTMSIEEVDGGFKKTCLTNASQSGEINCTVLDFSVEDGDYLVCVSTTKSSDANKYKIRYEQTSPCGFSGDYSGDYDYDFNIFAQTGMYSSVGEITLDSLGIEEDIMDYLSEKYDSNCTKGCIVPIRFDSGVTQQINLTEPSIIYIAGISAEEATLYNLEEIPPKISSNFQKLNLESEFGVPEDYGNYIFSLKFDEKNLFLENITVEKTPEIKFLTPSETAVNYETKFVVYTNWSSDIAEYIWDFGDGSNETTATNEVTHTYDNQGSYDIKITISDAKGRSSSKIFNVGVLPASEIVPILLDQIEVNIKNIKDQIKTFSVFEQKSLNYSLRLEELEDITSNFSYSLSESTLTDEDYETMLEQLTVIELPDAIEKTVSGIGILFYPRAENIDLTALNEITGENYTGEDEAGYKDAVIAWEEENVNTTMVYGEISTNYKGYTEPLLKTFDIKITKKETYSGEGYIVIKKMENLFFDKDYSPTELDDYYYLPLDQPEKEIIFSTTENVDFETLPFFIAPKINELSLINTEITNFEVSSRKWVIFGIVTGLIILIGAVMWILVRLWYKRKYENYLFSNRNNLLNIINYIDGEKKKGTNEKEILGKLKKAGWNSEQIKYALKRYSGKKII
jgi:PKD repeat protein